MISYEHFKIYCEIALSSSVMQRAIKVSLIVGTTLNLINQGDTLLKLDIDDLNLLKFLLTYLVPYSVTTYTATTLKIEFQAGTKAVIEADLKCAVCKAEVHVAKEEIIPECPNCGLESHWKLR